MSVLVIANTQIRQDAAARYCLNDLHQASGGAKRNQPSDWLRLKQTQELVLEIQKSPEALRESPEALLKSEEAPVAYVNDGFGNGTYVVKELVYAYAMWISAAFHLHVIRAYDALVDGQGASVPPPVPVAATHRADVLVSATRTFAALARVGRTLRMGHARALAAANAATYRATGIDLVEEMGAHDLLSPASSSALLPANDPQVAVIAEWLQGRNGVSMREIFAGALDGAAAGHGEWTRVAGILRAMGWRNVRRRWSGGNAEHRWFRPDAELAVWQE